MKVSVICIGDELLKGSTINTNLAFIGQELLKCGIIPFCSLTIPDDVKAVKESLDYLIPLSDLIITSGGLGPTADDMTKAVIAEYFGMKLVKNADAEKNIIERWNSFRGNQPIPDSVMTQALVPDGADMLPNSAGTAPGAWIGKKIGNSLSVKNLVMLPGPPHELRTMFNNSVIARIKTMMDGKLFTELFYLGGIPESMVEEKMIPVINRHPGLSVAYCASFWEVKLFLTSASEKIVASASAESREIFKNNIMQGRNLVEDCVEILKKEKCRIATAESCTGGMIAASITDLPGVSEVFAGSLVAYSNDVKKELLGVPEDILKKYGAVSLECADAMLENAAAKFKTECAISVTGIAGPSGGTPEKPVGLVCIGVKFKDKKLVKKFNFLGNREIVRMRSSACAFNMLRNLYYGLSSI